MQDAIVEFISKKNINNDSRLLPFRFTLAIIIILIEFLVVIAIIVGLCIYSRVFIALEALTQICCVISIISRNDNPDYKAPWLLFILVVPVVGFMSYLMFYSRKLSPRQIRQLKKAKYAKQNFFNKSAFDKIADPLAQSSALFLKKSANAEVYQNTNATYFSSGEQYFRSLIKDLKSAKEFIFLEYFIIKRGLFWNSILSVLKEKASSGVEVRVLYDDIGCMKTLPSNYYKTLRKMGIKCEIFSKLRGQANNEFNNRNHRKIAVVDGKVAYTGGLNLADEYINQVKKFGHWKDAGVRLYGSAVNELTSTFILDYNMSSKTTDLSAHKYVRQISCKNEGFCVPFCDGPNPVFDKQVSKTAIINMLSHAKRYVYMTTPYLIIDNELSQAIENTALRGVDVKIITPHIPDKKTIFRLTRSAYKPLIKSGVKIYEYTPGFVHAKTYLSDDETAIVGTVNLDYRSLSHHFENSVWFYRHQVIEDIKADFINTLSCSQLVAENEHVGGPLKRFFTATLKVFTPLL